MAKATGSVFGMRVCEVLGLDVTNIRSLTLHISAVDALTVTVERFVHDNEAEQIVTLLESYYVADRELVRDG